MTVPKKVVNMPSAGTTQPAGKSSDCDAVLLGHDPGARPSSAVAEVKCDEGAARRCIDLQVGQNGNPKKRNANSWGVGAAEQKNEDLLK